MKSTKFWVTVTAVLFVLACAGSFFALRGVSGGTAQVLSDGKVVASIELDAVTEPYSFTVTGKNGGKNTVSVERGRIRVSHADCPDGVCLRQGWIQTSVSPIVCLPNGLVISISGGEDSGVDAVS